MARYTKEQIIKALECCSKGNTVDSCMSGCPLYDLNDIPPCADDEQAIFKYALEHLKANVVPRSEVEELEKKLNDYERVVGKLSFTVDGVATLLIGKEVEYIDKRVAEGLKNMAVHKAKQEVAREIIDKMRVKIAEDDDIFEKCASRLVGSDYCNGRSEAIGFVLGFIDEIEKEYMGE